MDEERVKYLAAKFFPHLLPRYGAAVVMILWAAKNKRG